MLPPHGEPRSKALSVGLFPSQFRLPHPTLSRVPPAVNSNEFAPELYIINAELAVNATEQRRSATCRYYRPVGDTSLAQSSRLVIASMIQPIKYYYIFLIQN